MRNRTMSEQAVDQRLDKLAAFAAERRKAKADGLFVSRGSEGLERYVRINSRGFRVVSVGRLNPCGRVSYAGKDVVTTTAIDRARSIAESASGLTTAAPGNNKPEHGLQAFLIRRLLSAPDESTRLLGCESLFDRLILVTDEFAINNGVRADLLMLGRLKGESAFVPVFVELKAKRLATAIAAQLNTIYDLALGQGKAFEKQLDGRDIAAASTARRGAFERLLREATGSTAVIDLTRSVRIAILPKRDEKAAQAPDDAAIAKMRGAHIHIIEYERDGDDAYRLRVR